MKILHVLTSPRAEGTPRLVLDWLTVRDYDQYVLFLNSQPDDLLELFKYHTSQIFLVNTLGKYSLIRNFKILNNVKKISKEIKPGVVISWNQGYANWIIMGAKLGGVKKTILHGGCEPFYHNLPTLLFNYYVHYPIYLMNTKIICASQFIKEKFTQIPLLPKTNIYKVNNCIEYEKFVRPINYKRNSKIIAIVVANLEPVKNHIKLLEAWKIVRKRIPEAKLWIVGRGSLRNILEEFCNNNNLNESVIFWGERKDIPELLWQSKVFILPSLSEGFGTVLIEALAAGLYIIASDIPACREVLKYGEYGQIVDVNNVELLADSIIEKLKQPEVNEELYSKFLEYVKQFSPQNMINQYIEIIYK